DLNADQPGRCLELHDMQRALAIPMPAQARTVGESKLDLDRELQVAVTGDDRAVPERWGRVHSASLAQPLAPAQAFEDARRGLFGDAVESAHDVVHEPSVEDGFFEVFGGLCTQAFAERCDQVGRSRVPKSVVAGIASQSLRELVSTVHAPQRVQHRGGALVDEGTQTTETGEVAGG